MISGFSARDARFTMKRSMCGALKQHSQRSGSKSRRTRR
jgi:DNA replicative helicase MCM subunit Mcm2 (Cdc46/Mcm family)